MAISTIDGTVEEVVIRRRRSQGSFYDRIKFRLDDGSTKTWTKAHVANKVGDLLVPGTRGRFYFYRALDLRGLGGVRTDDGRAVFCVPRFNEYAGLGIAFSMTLLTVFNVTMLQQVSLWALILAILGVPMFFFYRQNRVDTERAFEADAGYRPAARAT